jgi:hypothetical protein
MNGIRRFTAIAAFATLAAIAVPAQAGRSCEVQPPRSVSVQQAMSLAERTARRLDETGAQVVVLARAGQNLSRYGLRYSHFGFAYRDGGRWRVVHKLNQCGTAHAAVFRQGLGEFFLDDLFEYEAAFVVLKPEVQEKLLPVLKDNPRIAQLNTPAYSMVAYPWAETYQQSNQWALETLAMSQDPAANTRSRAQAWLQLHGYTPTTLHLNAFTRLGARMTAANVAFDDHPNEKRFSDRIETVTVDSVFGWLQQSGLGDAPQTVR